MKVFMKSLLVVTLFSGSLLSMEKSTRSDSESLSSAEGECRRGDFLFDCSKCGGAEMNPDTNCCCRCGKQVSFTSEKKESKEEEEAYEAYQAYKKIASINYSPRVYICAECYGLGLYSEGEGCGCMPPY